MHHLQENLKYPVPNFPRVTNHHYYLIPSNHCPTHCGWRVTLLSFTSTVRLLMAVCLSLHHQTPAHCCYLWTHCRQHPCMIHRDLPKMWYENTIRRSADDRIAAKFIISWWQKIHVRKRLICQCRHVHVSAICLHTCCWSHIQVTSVTCKIDGVISNVTVVSTVMLKSL